MTYHLKSTGLVFLEIELKSYCWQCHKNLPLLHLPHKDHISCTIIRTQDKTQMQTVRITEMYLHNGAGKKQVKCTQMSVIEGRVRKVQYCRQGQGRQRSVIQGSVKMYRTADRHRDRAGRNQEGQNQKN